MKNCFKLYSFYCTVFICKKSSLDSPFTIQLQPGNNCLTETFAEHDQITMNNSATRLGDVHRVRVTGAVEDTGDVRAESDVSVFIRLEDKSFFGVEVALFGLNLTGSFGKDLSGNDQVLSRVGKMVDRRSTGCTEHGVDCIEFSCGLFINTSFT